MARPEKAPDAAPLKRVQLDMSPRPLARLQRLQERLEAASYAETIKRALWVHETLLDLAEGGGRILVERDGVTTELRIEGAGA